ncbi:MAG: PAS domain S-box protein [Bacillus subtilis]|nr:PAS domain S-box protein [Bacillus subtilis]
MYGKVALTGVPFEIEHYSPLIKKYLHISCFSPKSMQFATIVTDITDRVQMTHQLEESERKLRRAIDEAPIAIMIHAEDGEVIHVNNTWSELTGYSILEMKNVTDWLHLAYGKEPTHLEEIRSQLLQTRRTPFRRRIHDTNAIRDKNCLGNLFGDHRQNGRRPENGDECRLRHHRTETQR